MTNINVPIQLRRGLQAACPSVMLAGELYVCLDTGLLFAGTGTGVEEVGGGTAPVSEVFGRTGTIEAEESDYAAFYDVLGAASSIMNKISLQVSSTQLLALNTTPIEILSAPGAGIYYVIRQVIAKLTYGGTPYTGTGTISVDYGNPTVLTGVSMSMSNFLTGTANGIDIAIPSSISTKISAANPVNQPLYLHASSAITIGNGTLEVDVYYITSTF